MTDEEMLAGCLLLSNETSMAFVFDHVDAFLGNGLFQIRGFISNSSTLCTFSLSLSLHTNKDVYLHFWKYWDLIVA